MFSYTDRDTGLVNEQKRTEVRDMLASYHSHIASLCTLGAYDTPESAVRLPYDTALLEAVRTTADTLKHPDLAYVFVIGIGGSNLGAKAVYEGLGGMYDALLPQKPRLFFLDAIHAGYLVSLRGFIASSITRPEQCAVVIVSKSGTTTESLFHAEVLLSELKQACGGGILKRVVCVADDGTPLMRGARAQGITTLAIPSAVGGRFSIFSAAGLMPLALAGIDISSLVSGARMALDKEMRGNGPFPSQDSAAALFCHLRGGIAVHDTFLFCDRLRGWGMWYRQLLAESIGKETDRKGNTVRTGILPTVSLGSNDLHSVAQLYFAGPRNIFTTFVSVEKNDDSWAVLVPSERVFPEAVPMIQDASAGRVERAIFGGVLRAYADAHLPYAHVTLSSITPESLGALMQYAMLQIMYLGELLDVNVFDQPNVEAYKRETRRILESS